MRRPAFGRVGPGAGSTKETGARKMTDAKRREVAKCLRYVADRVSEGVDSGPVLDTEGIGCGRFQAYKDRFTVDIHTDNTAFEGK